MPATDVKFGITKHQGALIDSVEVEKKIEQKALKGSDGNVARVHVYNPTTSGTVKGHGELTVVPGVGDPGVSGVTGGVTVIPSVKDSESNEDFGGWEYGFDNYPNAEEV
jgi:hypothetical protein